MLVQGPGRVPLEEIDRAQGRKVDWSTKLGAKFFQELERFAQESGVAVDIMAAGMAAVNAPLLSKVATGTGGVLLLHQSVPPLSLDEPNVASMAFSGQILFIACL